MTSGIKEEAGGDRSVSCGLDPAGEQQTLKLEGGLNGAASNVLRAAGERWARSTDRPHVVTW